MENQSAVEDQFWHACVVVVFIVRNSHAHISSLFYLTSIAMVLSSPRILAIL